MHLLADYLAQKPEITEDSNRTTMPGATLYLGRVSTRKDFNSGIQEVVGNPASIGRMTSDTAAVPA